MRALIIGGSGYVASLILPAIAKHHEITLYDLRPPAETRFPFVQGDVCEYDAVKRAAEGMDAVLYMAMGIYPAKGHPHAQYVHAIDTSLDANVKGVYISLFAANHAGVPHAVYTSSMSVYHEPTLMKRYFPDEEMEPDATHAYGFTKRMGEQMCRNVWRAQGMSVNVLRICFPTPTEKWLEQTEEGTPTLAMEQNDLANLFLAALEYRAGYQEFMASGDYEQKITNLSKAKRLLGWEPLARPQK